MNIIICPLLLPLLVLLRKESQYFYTLRTVASSISLKQGKECLVRWHGLMNSMLSTKSLGFCFLSQTRYLLLAWLAVYGLKIELSRNKHAPDYKMRRICLFSDNSVFLNIPFPVCVRLYQLGGMMAPNVINTHCLSAGIAKVISRCICTPAVFITVRWSRNRLGWDTPSNP